MTWQSKEDQRDHIRAQLVHEIKNPSIDYPISKKNLDKLNTSSYKRSRKYQSTVQTAGVMQNELKDYVLNPDIPVTPNNHREIWREHHPNEAFSSNDIIHHINGNHYDNRPDNLVKVTPTQHRNIHKKTLRPEDAV